jgi:hypothetical protein
MRPTRTELAKALTETEQAAEERIRRYEHRTFYDLTTQERGSVTTVSYNLRREEEQIEGL